MKIGSKKNIYKMIAALFMASLLYVYCYSVFSQNSAELDNKEQGEKTEPFRYEPMGLRDPFIPLIKPTALPTLSPTPTMFADAIGTPTPTPEEFLEPPQIKLQIILYDQKEPKILVNDKFYSLGDTLVYEDAKVKIMEIKRDYIKVSYKGHVFDIGRKTEEY